MALTSFPSERAEQRRVRVRVLRHTVCAGVIVEAGDVFDVDHHEYLQLKAAGAAEIAIETPKARPVSDDDFAFLRVKGYRPESIEDAQRFLDNFAKQGQLGSYLAAVGAWVKDGRPGIDQLVAAAPAEGPQPSPVADVAEAATSKSRKK